MRISDSLRRRFRAAVAAACGYDMIAMVLACPVIWTVDREILNAIPNDRGMFFAITSALAIMFGAVAAGTLLERRRRKQLRMRRVRRRA